jgi:hypothetical protein
MSHWSAVKGILKYIRRTKDMVLIYGGCEEELSAKGYVDASFDTDPDDLYSQTGYVFMLNGGSVSWRSCKQELVAQSTMESEYMAASEAASEEVWLRKFVIELGGSLAWATLWTTCVTTRPPSPTPRSLELTP